MTIWLPVAFACLTNGTCAFHNGNLSVSLEQCQDQNKIATVAMLKDPDVKAYQVDCLEIKPKHTDSL